MIAGRYDEKCEELHLEIGGTATMLLVLGEGITGFSVTTRDQCVLWELPTILRNIANDIEAQNRKRRS